jgi:hypothetical protein
MPFTPATTSVVMAPRLRVLDVSYNEIKRFGATLCACAPQLVVLRLHYNQVRLSVCRVFSSLLQIPQLPNEIAQLQLVELNLAHNAIARLPDALSALTDLSVLELADNVLVCYDVRNRLLTARYRMRYRAD